MTSQMFGPKTCPTRGPERSESKTLPTRGSERPFRCLDRVFVYFTFDTRECHIRYP